MKWFIETEFLVEKEKQGQEKEKQGQEKEKQGQEYERKSRKELFKRPIRGNVDLFVYFEADMLAYNRQSDAEKHHEFLSKIHQHNFSSMKKRYKKKKN
jgi:hypothetical protein